MNNYIVLFFILVYMVTGCSIETHSMGIQKGCAQFKDMSRKELTQYYDVDRKPDKIRDLDDGRTEIVYYYSLHGDKSSLHWSGYVVWFMFWRTIPLLIPTGHHQKAYILSDGKVVECTNMWHRRSGTPTLH